MIPAIAKDTANILAVVELAFSKSNMTSIKINPTIMPIRTLVIFLIKALSFFII